MAEPRPPAQVQAPGRQEDESFLNRLWPVLQVCFISLFLSSSEFNARSASLARFCRHPAGFVHCSLTAFWQCFDVASVSKFFQQPTTPSTPQAAVQTDTNGNVQQVNPWLLPPTEVSLGWPLGQKLDMHVFLSTSSNGDVFTQWTNGWRKNQDEGLPQFVWENIVFGDYNDHRIAEFEVKFPEVRLLPVLLFSQYQCYVEGPQERIIMGRRVPR